MSLNGTAPDRAVAMLASIGAAGGAATGGTDGITTTGSWRGGDATTGAGSGRGGVIAAEA